MIKQRILDCVKAPIIAVLKLTDLYSIILLKYRGSLKNAGWFETMRKHASIDYHGDPIPWITYPAIEFLNKRISADMSVFEYGAGNSTLWWAKRVKSLVSCEHDKLWYEKIKMSVPPNVQLFHINLEYGGEYSKMISNYNSAFHIIIIDGRDRINCTKNALTALKYGGVIIWDNNDLDCYKEGLNYLHENGYKRIDFIGMGPMSVNAWSTAIFYKNDNCLKI